MERKKLTDKRLVAAIALLLLTITIVIILSLVQSSQVNESSKTVTHTQEVLLHSEKLLNAVISNQNDVRGYVITNHQNFKSSIQYSKTQMKAELDSLRHLTRDNPEQQINLDSLKYLIQNRIVHADSLVTIHDKYGDTASRRMIDNGTGRLMISQMKQLIAKLQDKEYDLLSIRKKINYKEYYREKNILIAAIIGMLVLIGVGIQKLRNDNIVRKRTISEISTLNEELELKVTERTGELLRAKKILEETFLRITDAVIGLDKNWRYTFINKRTGEMLHRDPETLLGKNVWDEFPDAVGSATYEIFHKAMKEQRYMWNEDFYEPLNLWQENHVYPSPEGLSVFIRDISERKRNEEEIRESNRRYQYVTQATSDAIWDWDLLSGKIFWGEGVYNVFGYEVDKLEPVIGSWENRIHEDDREKVVSGIYRIIEGTENRWTDQYRYLKADGTYAIVIDRGIVIRNTKGKAVRMVGAMQDITEKKDLEILLDKATNLARIGSWEVNLVKNTVYFSDITRNIHELDDNFVPTIENGIAFYKEGYNRDTITRIMREAMEKGTSWDTELQIITPSGKEKWIRAIGETEIINGTPVRLFGSFQDIDSRKRAELAVAETLEDINNILESIGDGFLAVDRNWTVTYWNNHAEKILKKSREEMLGKHYWESFPNSVGTDTYKYVTTAMDNKTVQHFETYSEYLCGWFEVSVYPSERGLSVFFKDITERKNAEARLSEMNETLQKNIQELAVSNRELEQFAYIASHDLQEPLRMVTGFLTQLEKKYNDIIDAKGKQYIYFAVDGAKRMRQIILDLLEYSRVGKRDDILESVDINQLLEEIKKLHQKNIKELNAEIIYRNMPSITALKTPLLILFQNLLSNALKYHKKNIAPIINIEAKDNTDYWEFSITDNGIGFDQQYADKVFILFQRLHGRDEYGGTGMGLAIAKKIVETMGGRIWVHSEEGKGSVFYFSIPKL